jgi:UDP-N-acetylmuramyl tripeptide synthase
MLRKQTVRVGKLVKKAMRLRGGGSALPGLVVEKMSPRFLTQTLGQLSKGVVVVTGTNGKTTTTKIVVELLRAHGMKVFTNPSGSNFTRGIVASLLDHIDNDGRLDADIAVVELDEAYAVHFTKAVAPAYSLILNIFRDQLDRFGEIDHTAQLLRQVVETTTNGVVLNRDDELVAALERSVLRDLPLRYFGVSDKLLKLFPSDAGLRGGTTERVKPVVKKGDVVLQKLHNQTATFSFGESPSSTVSLKLSGIYNVQNAAAALAMSQLVLGDTFDEQKALDTLATVRPAFGRGEAITVASEPLEIVLVKNPSGFRLSLASYADHPVDTMIAINDLYADGRDMSWLWDVDFASFAERGVSLVSGLRTFDMALRLQYDNVTVQRVIPDNTEAIQEFLRGEPKPRRIFCTYTAMLAIRRELAKTYPLEAIE